jgi:hypothetical protein
LIELGVGGMDERHLIEFLGRLGSLIGAMSKAATHPYRRKFLIRASATLGCSNTEA